MGQPIPREDPPPPPTAMSLATVAVITPASLPSFGHEGLQIAQGGLGPQVPSSPSSLSLCIPDSAPLLPPGVGWGAQAGPGRLQLRVKLLLKWTWQGVGGWSVGQCPWHRPAQPPHPPPAPTSEAGNSIFKGILLLFENSQAHAAILFNLLRTRRKVKFLNLFPFCKRWMEMGMLGESVETHTSLCHVQ